MPTYYDPLNNKALTEQADAFYAKNDIDHLAPLRDLNPINLEDLGATSPVKVLKALSRGSKLFKRYLIDPARASRNQVQLDAQASKSDSEPGFKAHAGRRQHVYDESDKFFKVKKLKEGSDKLQNVIQQSFDYDLRKMGTGIYIYKNDGSSANISPYLQIPYIPSEVTTKVGANFAKINILNRNNIPYHFINASEEITFNIQWYEPNARLGHAYRNARKLQLLGLMDSNKFPHTISIMWGRTDPMFSGTEFIVKSAKIRMHQFHTSRTKPSASGNQKGFILPARVEQEVTLIRVEGPGYWPHSRELQNIPV